MFPSRGGLLSLCVWLVLSAGLQAQSHTDKRQVSRSFSVDRASTLEVQNKYGQVELLNWDRDSVRVEVEITLSESSASKLRKLRDDLHIDFTGTQSYIIAKTRIESESGRIASELRSVGHALQGSNKRMEINYTIHLPAYMDVVIQNKFGDVYVEDIQGQSDIRLSNGALKADRLQGASHIELSFANGMIGVLGSSTLHLGYADLSVGEVEQLDLDSRSSKLKADRAGVVKIASRRDELDFASVEYLYGTGDFTQVRVHDFLRECDVYLKYGNLTLDRVDPAFARIYVESSFTDIKLWFEAGTAFDFDILHHDKAILHLPASQVQARENPNGKEHWQTLGHMGEGASSGTVKIDALEKCFINLSFK
ncbi:MAG: hypothetical protein R2751_19205 [Bacteroidales bacterium]